LVVETFHSRFSTDGIDVYAFGDGDTTSGPLDLLKLIEPAVRTQLKRTNKADTFHDFSITRIAVDDRGVVRATVQMWVPKRGPSSLFDVTVTIIRKAERLDARIVSVRKSREQP
jgi:hypothetical protein